jgi:hypothetical protein
MKDYLNPESPSYVTEESPGPFETYDYLRNKLIGKKWGRYRLYNGDIFELKAEHDTDIQIDNVLSKNAPYDEIHSEILQILTPMHNLMKVAEAKCKLIYILKLK